MSDPNEVGSVKGRTYFTSEYECQSLNTFEVCMFDSHDAGVSEQLLRVIVNQLPEKQEQG